MAKEQKRHRRRKDNKSIDPKFLKLKKWIMSLFVIIFAVPVLNLYADKGFVWSKADNGIDEVKITAICAVDSLPGTLYAGSGRSLYKSIDSGEHWRRVFILGGEYRGINFISYDKSDPTRIFLATSDGLYMSEDSGESWNRSFRGIDELKRYVLCINANYDSSIIMIGTKKGLFQSIDKGKTWIMEKTFTNKYIISITMDNGYVYVCAMDGVYCSKGVPSAWDRIYIANSYEDDASGIGNSLDFNGKQSYSELNYLASYDGKVYLATDEGLYSLALGKREWQAISYIGLKTKNIKFILSDKHGLFAATDMGICIYNNKYNLWKDCSTGLATLKVNMIGISLEEALIYAATDKGLFKADLNSIDLSYRPADMGYEYLFSDNEPGILKIQQATINYAEVSPDKIKWMRRAAQNKALLPKVSLGLDGDVGRTIDLDRGGTTTPDFYIEGPRDKDRGWDISLSWDLGELIWNDDQTNIDVRSRLMVQLRNDVLDEVTKLYFERKRLQIELLKDPPDDNKRVLKQLRFDELTANIDSLTGGYLSECLQ